MPVQRGARGAYARYICNHCRKRKIKCDLPVDIDIDLSRQPQAAATSCQRCIARGLECVVDFTILGRPSTVKDLTMTRKSSLSKPSHDAPTHTGTSGADLESEAAINDYLVVQPQRTAVHNEPALVPQHRRPQPADKLQAMTNPSYLLSTLLQRDRQFASAVPSRSIQIVDIRHLVDVVVASDVENQLVWHRLFYPDMPSVAALRQAVLVLDFQDPESLSVVFLYVLLCLLAMEIGESTVTPSTVPHACLESLATQLAQRTILTLPAHRYAILGLELLMAYKPLLLVSDSEAASDTIRARVVSPMLGEIAQDLDIDASPTKLKHQLLANALPLDSNLVDDCLKWYRLCLTDAILAGKGRQGEQRHMMGDTLAGTVDVFRKLLESDGLPSEHLFAYHSLLCQAYKLEYMLQVKDDWQNLENLSRVIDDHKEACEWQRQSRKAIISALRPEEALVATQLLDMQLHTAYCWVSGSATFYAVMAGAQTRDLSTDIDAQQALDVSDQIIERFAESTGHKHASEPHTEFLIKYGSGRMDDLELALLNYVSAMDNLSLEGVPYMPPTKHTTSHLLYTVKDIMEGQAARMKGWGGLHERTHLHLLLIRDCANSLEQVGARLSGVTGAEAIAKGCLWASTARLIRSLHRLLGEWKKWNALGQVKISTPSQANNTISAGDGAAPPDLEDIDFVPDDLFFDWSLWLSQDDILM